MTRVSLPSLSGKQRQGLALLWKSEIYAPDSLFARAQTLLAILILRLKAAPLAALAAVVSLTAVLSLSFFLLVVALNARQALTQGTTQVTVRVIPLQPDLAPELERRLAELPQIRSARIVSKAQALTEFAAALGESKSLLDGLETDNPLPVTVELTLANIDTNPQATVEALVKTLQLQEGVAEVVYNASLVSSLGELLRGVKYFGLITIISVLMIGAILVGMTIRLGVYAHRHEIEVMQLVGAERAHIQLPFIVEALSVGFVASVISALLVSAGISWFGNALATSSISWLFAGEAAAMPVWVWLAILILGPVLSLAAALVALRLQGQR